MSEKKRSVLIVDDEFRIGILIKKLIRWSELDMECQDVLDNGESALRVMKDSRPDIVITDVPVSYTHLDVYKRQGHRHRCPEFPAIRQIWTRWLGRRAGWPVCRPP